MPIQSFFSKKGSITKTLLTLSVCAALLSGCGLFSRNPKTLSQTLDKFHASELDKEHSVVVPDLKESLSWENPIETVNLNNFKVKGNLSNFVQIKILALGDKIATDPVITKNHAFILTQNGQIKAYSNLDKKLAWSYDLGFHVQSSSATLMSQNGKLYATAQQYLVVLSCENGTELCYRKFSNRLISGVCVEGQTAYLSDACNLYAIDLEANRVLYKSPGIIESIAVDSKFQPVLYSKKMLLTNHFAKQLTFVDPTKMGAPVIQMRQPNSKKGNPSSLLVSNFVNQPVIDGQHMYFGTYSGIVQKYDVEKNNVNWSRDIPYVQRLAKLGNILIAVTLSNQAIAINCANGKVLWVTHLPVKRKSTHEFLAPLCINSNLILLSKTGDLISISPQNGCVTFYADLKLKDAISVAVVNDKLLICTPTKILATN